MDNELSGLYDRGKTLFQESKFVEAADVYTKIIKTDAFSVRCLLNRASCNIYLNNWKSALEDALAARKQDPHSLKALRICAQALNALNDVNGAIDCLLEALYIDFTDSKALSILKNLVFKLLKKYLQVRYLT